MTPLCPRSAAICELWSSSSDVGRRPLTDFKNTKKLVGTIRNSVKGTSTLPCFVRRIFQQPLSLGHWLAVEASVLHRDVSVGTIRICDSPLRNLFREFLHDSYYSSMVSFVKAIAEEILVQIYPTIPDDKKAELLKNVRERTVSLMNHYSDNSNVHLHWYSAPFTPWL